MAKPKTIIAGMDVVEYRKGDPTPTAEAPEVHIVGLTKVAPNRYAVVTGTAANHIVDNVSQPLEYAAETLKVALLKMLQVMP